MSKSNRISSTLLAALMGGATLLAGGNALAQDFEYSLGTYVPDGDEFGNSRFWAKYSYSASEESDGRRTGDITTRSSLSLASFWVQTQLFNKLETPIVYQAGGNGLMTKSGSAEAQFVDQVYAQAEFDGDEQLYVGFDDTPCEGHDSTWSCIEFSKEVSKTLFSASATFMLSFVPVTVEGRATGALYGTLFGSARASKYLGKADSLRANSYASLGAGAYVKATLSAFAGVADVLAVGVTASIKLIDVSLTPTVSSIQNAPFNAVTNARVKHTNVMPLNLKTLSGKVKVWADISPFLSPSKTLIDWDGYEWTTPLSGFEDVFQDV